MLSLWAGPIGAPASTALLPAGKAEAELMGNNSVFFLGPDKTGTDSLEVAFRQLAPWNWNPCHDVCEPEKKQWWQETQDHRLLSDVLSNHRAFMDNGHLADFGWLDRTFPDSRFVLNTRGLQGWAISRYDQATANRARGGCSAVGNSSDCKWGKDAEGKATTFTENDNDSILRWVLEAANSQAAILRYFGQDDERRQRFVEVDVVGRPAEDTLMRLLWITRKDPDDHPLGLHLATLAHTFSQEVQSKWNALVSESNVTLPSKKQQHHDEKYVTLVQKALYDAGCKGGMLDATDYTDCAKEILANTQVRLVDALPWLNKELTNDNFEYKWVLQKNSMPSKKHHK